jgi:uncharacterized protein YbjT (DUF2867 family)
VNKKIFVTGGGGTLGRKLTPLLREAGYDVRLSSQHPPETRAEDSVEWVQAALESADEWANAVRGVDTIVHAASAPFKRGLDSKGTQRILNAASQAGISHIVYISIVGVDKKSWFYYEEKFLCEQLISKSGIPFTILRATQFHEFVDILLKEMFLRLPIGILPKGWRIQPIDSGEVAGMLAASIEAGPSGYLEDAGGPEILAFEELASIWMDANGRRPTIKLPFPFLMGRAFTTTDVLAPEHRIGQITWRDWVATLA